MHEQKGDIVMKKIIIILATALVMSLFTASASFANKASVTIDAPQSASQGSEITIKVNVFHSADNPLHYTNWVYIKVNGKEIARWDFTSSKRPESNNFSREIKYKVSGPTVVTAEANCNIHGSAGPATLEIK